MRREIDLVDDQQVRFHDAWSALARDLVAGGDDIQLLQQLGLTGREAEVLLWVSRGKANREMGQILGISPRTVNKHLEQIFVKLGVENRASAAARAVRLMSR